MPGADLQTALLVGERLRESLSRTEIPTEHGALHITVSIGAACLEEGDDADLESLLDRADTALYAAKRSGRNRVLSTSSAGPESAPVAVRRWRRPVPGG